MTRMSVSTTAMRTCAFLWNSVSRGSLAVGLRNNFWCGGNLLNNCPVTISVRQISCGCLLKPEYGTGSVVRCYSTSPSAKSNPSSKKSLQETHERDGGAVTLTTAEKVKENVKTVSYGGVIVVGVLVGGAMLYYVMKELLSSESPNNIYSHAFKMCKLSTEVQDALGTPIKCYGEETRRGWRRHVAYQEFLAGDTKFLRMRFYVEGTFRKGTVNVEKKTNNKGKYEYTYIIVDVDGYPARRIEVPF